MTFREKYFLDHPNNRRVQGCPYSNNYETKEEGTAACEKMNCSDCWNRKMPTKYFSFNSLLG